MAYLWRLKRKLKPLTSDANEISWPTQFIAKIQLSPGDFFGVEDGSQIFTTISKTTTFEIDLVTGKLRIKNAPGLTNADLSASFPDGVLSLKGNAVRIEGKAASFDQFQLMLNWIWDRMTLFLSVHAGIFFEIIALDLELGGKKFIAIYPEESFSIAFAQVTEDERSNAIFSALNGPNQDQKSYARYAASCHYFQQALRLISPMQVQCIPYTVYSEVLLNLCKSIDALVSSSSHEDLRKRLILFGFTADQIESQIIPIFKVRNEIDVAHISLTSEASEDISTLRLFVGRSLQNVATILQAIGSRIASGDDLLEPVLETQSSKRVDIINRITKYLGDPPLDPDTSKRRPVVFSTK